MCREEEEEEEEEERKNSGQSLFTGIEELINQILFLADVPGQ
jgi:hypothetical protein